MGRGLKHHIARELGMELGITQREAYQAINSFIHHLVDSLQKNGTAQIRGLGTFSVRKRKPGSYRNPRTGKKFEIESHNYAHFKPSINIKRSINA